MNAEGAHSDSERLVICASRGKMVLAFFGSMVFVSLGIWIGIVSDERGFPIWKTLIASYVGVPFFTCGTLYSAYRLLVRKAVVIADATGLTDNASLTGAGHLCWAEIDHVIPYQVLGQWMLGIAPADVPAFMARRNLLQRCICKLNIALGFFPANIPQATLPMPVHELAELLHARFGVRISSLEDPWDR